MPGKLTTHVLDTCYGCPAAGVKLELWREADGQQMELLTSTTTNGDGRVDSPLLSGDDFRPGTYELRFKIGDYFRGNKTPLAEVPFLDVVPIRFGVAAATANYHVPLLISPWAYSTYRGS